ncbi:MAG TPA: hypothetical protein PLY97_10140 [Acidocella sp.]|nr:hypothetical protein [Acidocella sp.]
MCMNRCSLRRIFLDQDKTDLTNFLLPRPPSAAGGRQGQKRHIVALHWDNIDPRMVATQAEVFRHLGYTITQTCLNKLSHGVFLDRTLAEMGEDDLVLCMDIDCFPTNREIVEHAFDVAEAGGLIGCAQVSMHIDPMRIFTAPCFLALSRRTWDGLGRPSFRPDAKGDVGQGVHDAALAAGVKVEYIRPWACALPKWNLANHMFYGIGTFYRGGVFHLYESRNSPYAFLFYAVAEDVLAGRETDILALCRKTMKLYAFERPITKWVRFKIRQKKFLKKYILSRK